MPNSILYNVSTQSLALKKGNFWIGTGDVGKGPTSSTGYFDGVTPGANQYVIYYNKSGSNRIYYCTNGDQVYLITNRLKGQNLTTLESALAYIATQNDMMCTNINYEPIVTNGLILNLDAGFIPSYPRSGTTWYDISSNGFNSTLTNGPTFNSGNGGSIVFDGVDDYAFVGVTISARQNKSYVSYIKLSNSWSSRGSIFAGARNTTNSFDVDSSRRLTAGEDDVFIVSPIFMSPNTWYNVAYTFEFDGNTTAIQKLYVNGALSATLTTSNYIDGYITSQTYIGYDSRFFQYFNGEISMLQIYNKTLSAEEIAQNFNAQKSRYGII